MDGPVRYNIIHYKQLRPGEYGWTTVGSYEGRELTLDMSEVVFSYARGFAFPSSVCSAPCVTGQAKKFVEGEKCCWHCFNCTKYQRLINATDCAECDMGQMPA